MKNQSTNKMPQATCSGDVVGGSVVRGMLGAFCFLSVHRIKSLADGMDKDEMNDHNLFIHEALTDAINDLDRCIERIVQERIDSNKQRRIKNETTKPFTTKSI